MADHLHTREAHHIEALVNEIVGDRYRASARMIEDEMGKIVGVSVFVMNDPYPTDRTRRYKQKFSSTSVTYWREAEEWARSLHISSSRKAAA